MGVASNCFGDVCNVALGFLPSSDTHIPNYSTMRRVSLEFSDTQISPLGGPQLSDGKTQSIPNSDLHRLLILDRDHPTTVYDVHATILHLLGIDHTKLTVRHNGIDRRLTDVHGRVIQKLIA